MEGKDVIANCIFFRISPSSLKYKFDIAGVHIFTKIKNKDGWKKKKSFFSGISFQKFLIFTTWPFSENAQSLVQVFL